MRNWDQMVAEDFGGIRKEGGSLAQQCIVDNDEEELA